MTTLSRRDEFALRIAEAMLRLPGIVTHDGDYLTIEGAIYDSAINGADAMLAKLDEEGEKTS